MASKEEGNVLRVAQEAEGMERLRPDDDVGHGAAFTDDGEVVGSTHSRKQVEIRHDQVSIFRGSQHLDGHVTRKQIKLHAERLRVYGPKPRRLVLVRQLLSKRGRRLRPHLGKHRGEKASIPALEAMEALQDCGSELRELPSRQVSCGDHRHKRGRIVEARQDPSPSRPSHRECEAWFRTRD
jgi:hypothetical protein